MNTFSEDMSSFTFEKTVGHLINRMNEKTQESSPCSYEQNPGHALSSVSTSTSGLSSEQIQHELKNESVQLQTSQDRRQWEGFNFSSTQLPYKVEQEKPFLFCPKREQWLWYKSLVIPLIRVSAITPKCEDDLIARLECWKETYSKSIERIPLEGITTFQMRSQGISISGIKFVDTTFLSQGARFYLTLSIQKSTDPSDYSISTPSTKIATSDVIFISKPLLVEARRQLKKKTDDNNKNGNNFIRQSTHKQPFTQTLPSQCLNNGSNSFQRLNSSSHLAFLQTKIDLNSQYHLKTTTKPLKRIPALQFSNQTNFELSEDQPTKRLCIESTRSDTSHAHFQNPWYYQTIIHFPRSKSNLAVNASIENIMTETGQSLQNHTQQILKSQTASQNESLVNRATFKELLL